MQLKFFCPHWGSKHLPFTEFTEKVKATGYDGVEMSLPMNDKERNYILDCLKDQSLLLIAQHWETNDAGFGQHMINYCERLENLAKAQPLFINSQTGKDFFSYDQNAALIKAAGVIAATYNIEILHETHRGKFSFAAHITKEFLDLHPQLQLTLDVSHWLVVAESLLADQQQALKTAIERAGHIHARIGFPGGPQIPDPRAPEWSETVSFHIGIWEKIISKAIEQEKEFFTITPEFGPYPYMTMLPHTQKPIASQWDVNVYMMHTLKKHFSS
ncbi:MAG TPA: sugar phosphate isomerase/epimerase [Chitinophagaceae bacterium]